MATNTRFYKKNRNRTSLYPKDIFEKLEFDKVQELLLSKCRSPLGKRYVERMKWIFDAEEIEELLRETAEFKQLEMFEEHPFPAENYLDVSEELKLLAVNNSVLNESQFFRLYRVLEQIHAVFRYFEGSESDRKERYPSLFSFIADLSFNKMALRLIKDIIDKDGKVRSDASKELVRIRRAIQSCYRDLDRKFNAIIADYKKKGWLSDTVESIRAGRRVLSVTSEHKRKVNGIVHDISGTGSTSFIEPEATLQINNEIVELQQAERQEIYRILKQLTIEIRPFAEDFKEYQTILGIYDFVRAKALFAIDTNSHQPRLSDDKSVEIFNARHPLLLLKNKNEKKETIPLNMHLSLANRLLVVSGPNAGGKSVMLKTVGLMQIMLQTGMLVPCNDNSIMNIFQKIFADIGDEQSIENDLSTYSSHLKNMRFFTENANAKTLILIDEFGSGTDPALGGPIAEAILEQLNSKFCYGVITTHYSNLKVYATETAGIFNGCMTFDHRNLSPLYKLDIGKPGSSFAFELATKSGLSQRIIDRAKSKVDSSYKQFDELLTNLQREKQAVLTRETALSKQEQKLKNLIAQYEKKTETLDKQKQKIILETQEKAQDYLQETNKRFEKMVQEWKENKGEKKIVKQIKTELEQDRNKVEQTIEKLQDQIYYKDIKVPVTKGVYVRLFNGKEVGEVLELRRNQAIVEFSGLRTHVPLKKLVVVEKVEPPKENPAYKSSLYNSLQARSEFESTIDVRGMRRDETLKKVEDFVDKALIYNIDELKIIHGLGDGILRKSIRDMLRKVRAVKSVHDEEPQYGGSGVSIVELA